MDMTSFHTPFDISTLFIHMKCRAGRPLPPTPASSLLPPAPPPPSGPLHPGSPAVRECQVPLLDSSSSHTVLEPHPDDEFSPNSYLLRACAPPAQPPAADPLCILGRQPRLRSALPHRTPGFPPQTAGC
ncbi:hypothetical protein MATL_G00169000 [Megalops atlanticus]|uniref:Teneurin N-terminal domain-containing protein n=1 Tax=Megalops atlanticus TaxID=7932 RepID=A0A9D3PSQ4_MEGAT|nr:hypothetical protein MATL_G00169000 [Megalops atlanticus]